MKKVLLFIIILLFTISSAYSFGVEPNNIYSKGHFPTSDMVNKMYYGERPIVEIDKYEDPRYEDNRFEYRFNMYKTSSYGDGYHSNLPSAYKFTRETKLNDYKRYKIGDERKNLHKRSLFSRVSKMFKSSENYERNDYS